eukprot:4156687-Amphidinium_carterae.1
MSIHFIFRRPPLVHRLSRPSQPGRNEHSLEGSTLIPASFPPGLFPLWPGTQKASGGACQPSSVTRHNARRAQDITGLQDTDTSSG